MRKQYQDSRSVNQRVVIKIGSGSIETGYTAAVQISDEGMAPRVETQAYLPPAPDLPALYQQWQQSYWQLGQAYRLEAQGGVTNVSAIADTETCLALSRQLRDRIHHWLNGDDFRPIREKLLEQLSTHDTVRFLLQTQDPLLQRLPWYELQFYERYRLAEVGICALDYQQTSYQGTRSAKVRILAIIGDATGLNTQIDQALLKNLPDADIHFLTEPDRETFNRCLWDAKGWDILFFAGHSNSRSDCHPGHAEGGGEIFLNVTDRLTIPQLKHALKKAIERGLNTAIFNSCDGLGLAADLADLHIPQVLVMREPVPDPVAHAFLQSFLESFAAGDPFYVAVREAREKLQGLEARFPCATWLPVIVQNPAETPPTWHSLQGKTLPFPPSPPALLPPNSPLPARKHPRKIGIGTGLLIATAILLGRQLGWLQPYELKAYDHLLRLRPAENIDSRLLIITNTEEDIARQADASRSSLSDQTLLELLNQLTPLNPQLIGLDIYRPQPTDNSDLAQKLNNIDRLIAICKVPDRTTESSDQAPPPEIEDQGRIGASDFVDDNDQVLRRHLMYFEPVPGADCRAGKTFSFLIALRYLKEVHNIQFTEDNQFLGTARFPAIQSPSFGGYHDLDQAGFQTLLNYRLLRDPMSAGCGEVKETPADCLSVSEVLAKDGSQLRDSVEGRIVLIGTTDMSFGYQDRWTTPYTPTAALEDQTPGVFLQAQMISQLVSAAIEGRPLLTSWPEWIEMVWILGWAVGGGLIGVYSRWGYRLWLRLLLAEGALLLICWVGLTRSAVWLPWVPGAIALPAAALTSHTILKTPTPASSSRHAE